MKRAENSDVGINTIGVGYIAGYHAWDGEIYKKIKQKKFNRDFMEDKL